MRYQTRLAAAVLVVSLTVASLLLSGYSGCDSDPDPEYSFAQNEYATTVEGALKLRVNEFRPKDPDSPPKDVTEEAGAWTVYPPDQGASVSEAGLFTATRPGSYRVRTVVHNKDCSVLVVVTGAAAEIFNNGNGLAIDGGGTPPSFEVANEIKVAEVTTYHDTASTPGLQAGTITLKGEDGKTYGPFQSTGSNGQGGDANAYWIVKPENVVLPPGRYTIIDSDPQSFAQNAKSGGVGMAWISATPAN